jgi:glycolate oxidase FAD binding subunit
VGVLMSQDLKPRDARDVEEAVRAALVSGEPLELVGQGTKRGIGHAMSRNSATKALLDLSGLDQVVAYEPSELVLTAQPGLPMATLNAMLAERHQELAFEPMDVSELLGIPHGSGTLGGAIISGLSGPRRIKAGAARDHVLGVHAVSGFGESFKAGGRVVKNVTGYDVAKLIAGSWGTLAAMTELTVKVLPRAESETTLVLKGLDDVTAGRAMTAAIGSPYDVSGAAHGLAEGSVALTLIRCEGIAASVAHRLQSLSEALKAFGGIEQRTGDASAALWRQVRDVTPFAQTGALGDRPVWRIICPPASGGSLSEALRREADAELIADWAGGLIWAAVPASADAKAAIVRREARRTGGHATLIRASDAVKEAVDVFEPLDGGLAALHERVRASFDPHHLFNRGRMRRA